MSFKKRLLILSFTTVFVVVALAFSVVSIFANRNLLVKTNISLLYTAPTITDAKLGANIWQKGQSEKTELVALTDVNAVTEQVATTVTESLRESNSYIVFEHIIENNSSNTYYVQFQYTDTDSDDTNIFFKWCYSVGTQLQIDEVQEQDFKEINELYWKGTTNVVGNLEIEPNKTTYIYVVAGVKDLLKNAKFTGSVNFNLHVDPYDDSPQVNVVSGSGNYYVYMGEMPQSYAGTDGTAFTLQQETYTECGVEYEVYKDATGNKYAKKDGAYYKFEKIKWRIWGYDSTSNATVSSSPNINYGSTAFSSKKSKYLFISSDKILFNSAWNSTLTRANYPNSTIYANLTEFYNNVLKEYANLINDYTATYNLVETKTFTTLEDSSTNSMQSSVVQKLFIPDTNLAKHNYFLNSAGIRKAYYTSWAVGSESTTTYGKWWTRTNQYNNTDGEIFVANAVGTDGNFVATNINEVCGVRPVMVITLP